MYFAIPSAILKFHVFLQKIREKFLIRKEKVVKSNPFILAGNSFIFTAKFRSRLVLGLLFRLVFFDKLLFEIVRNWNFPTAQNNIVSLSAVLKRFVFLL